jgi:hypothetical protein
MREKKNESEEGEGEPTKQRSRKRNVQEQRAKPEAERRNYEPPSFMLAHLLLHYGARTSPMTTVEIGRKDRWPMQSHIKEGFS